MCAVYSMANESIYLSIYLSSSFTHILLFPDLFPQLKQDIERLRDEIGVLLNRIYSPSMLTLVESRGAHRQTLYSLSSDYTRLRIRADEYCKFYEKLQEVRAFVHTHKF